MKRAILYARVSTDQQADNGYSLPTQLAAMREYTAKHGFEIVGEFADDFTGTSPVAERPEGQKIYEMLRQREIDAVIMYTIDRVARDADVVEFAIFKRDVKRAGAELHFVDTGKVSEDIMGGLLEYIKAAGASDELKKIRERTSRGRIAKAQGGKWVGCAMPYGYRKIGKGRETRMEIDPQAGAIVRRIFAMFLGYEGCKRNTLNGITIVLMQEGAATPRRGRKWIRATVRFILTNRTYIGIYTYKGHQIEIPELAIIPQDWYDAVQTQLGENKNLAQRNRKYDYLLAGRLICTCGRRMYGKQHDPSGYRYHCRESIVLNRAIRTCEEKSLLGHTIDAEIWAELTKRLDSNMLAESVRAYRKQAEISIDPKRQRLLSINEEIERESKRIRKYMQAFADTEDVTIAAECQVTVKDAARRKDALLAQKRKLEDEIAQATMSDADERAILKTVNAWKKKIESGGAVTFEQKRHLLDLLHVQVKLRRNADKREVEVSYILSAESFTIPIESKSS